MKSSRPVPPSADPAGDRTTPAPLDGAGRSTLTSSQAGRERSIEGDVLGANRYIVARDLCDSELEVYGRFDAFYRAVDCYRRWHEEGQNDLYILVVLRP